MTEAMYFFGFSTTAMILGAGWLACALYAAWRYALAFIDDAEVKKIFGFEMHRTYCGPDGGNVILGLFLSAMIVLLASWLWVLAWPLAFAIGFMLAARKFRRFTKMFKRHQHDGQGQVIDRGWQ